MPSTTPAFPFAADPERSAALLRLLFEHAGEGISVFDGAMRLVAWNQRFLDCTGLAADCARVGMPLRELALAMARAGEYGPCDPEAEADRRLTLLREGPPTVTQRVRPNGRVLELRRDPTPDGGFVMLYADITERRDAEAALADQQRMLALLQQRTEQGFWFIDNDLRTTDVNPAMCRMLGLSREQLLGRDIYAFVDEANAKIFRAHVKLRALGLAEGYEITLRRADGTPVHCYNNATPIVDGSGNKVGAVGLFSDITRLKRAEQQARQAGELLAQKSRLLKSTLESLSQGVLSIDPQGRINTWNRRVLELLQVPEDVMREQPLFEGLLKYQVEHGLLGPSPVTGLARAPVYQRTRPDGMVLEVRTSHADDGSVVRTYTDVTTSVQAQQALHAAKEEAERANRAKSEFLSRMSHELRTPLNAVLGFAQLMESDAADPLSPGQRARVHELARGGRHLLSLINEVLDLARIEAGTLRLQLATVELPGIIDDSLRLVQPMAAERGIAMHVQGDIEAGPVQADPTRLKQVLLNLLSNAIKYNRPGGSVHLSWYAEPGRSSVRIDVRDSGPGLDAAQQERLFQAFERLDAGRTDVEGTGIGLVLSKWLVELMRGELGVCSTPGLGSTFWVRLAREAAGASAPPAPAPLAPARALPDAPASTRTHRVLYIEDNTVNQVLMEGMLRQRPGILLATAGLPEEGLAMAAQSTPDLVLLDIQLPGMDGYEVLRHLRQQPALRDVPVVAVSANAMETDLEQARRVGFADYITKPIDLHRLLAVVDRLLAP